MVSGQTLWKTVENQTWLKYETLPKVPGAFCPPESAPKSPSRAEQRHQMKPTLNCRELQVEQLLLQQSSTAAQQPDSGSSFFFHSSSVCVTVFFFFPNFKKVLLPKIRKTHLHMRANRTSNLTTETAYETHVSPAVAL